MRIAVTGSSGLVGLALCDKLLSAGHEVVRLVRNQRESISPNTCLWLPSEGVQQLEKIERVDAIVHLAGRNINAKRWTSVEKERIRMSRVDATGVLAAQLSQLPTSRPAFICASAIGYYGDCGSIAVPETAPVGNGYLATLVRDWEGAAQPLIDAGNRVAFARLGIVLSPKGGALAKMLPLFRWCLGGRLGTGRQYWSWISLHDAVQAFNKLISGSECTGAYNFVAPHSVSNSEFTRGIAKYVRRPAILPAPRFALRLALGELADEMLLSSCRAIPERLIREGFQFQHPTLESCVKSLV